MEWEQRVFRIPYRLGFIKLSEIKIDTIVPRTHYSAFPETMSSVAPAELSTLPVSAAYIATCPIEGHEPMVSRTGQYIRYISSRFPHYATDTDGDFDEYLQARFPGKRRRKLKNMVRKFEKHSSAEQPLRLYRTREEVAEFYDLAQEVARHTYQARLLKGCLPVDDPTFKADLCDKAACNEVRGYLLFEGDKAIAYACFEKAEANVLIYEHCGQLAGYENFSPGTIILYQAIQDAFADPEITIMDLSEGEGMHKRRFATRDQICGDVFFFKMRPQNALVVASHVAFTKATEHAMGLLETLKIKQQIKKLMKRAPLSA